MSKLPGARPEPFKAEEAKPEEVKPSEKKQTRNTAEPEQRPRSAQHALETIGQQLNDLAEGIATGKHRYQHLHEELKKLSDKAKEHSKL